MTTNKAKYRILTKDHKFLNAGTAAPSWFTLEVARLLVSYEHEQAIVEHNGVEILWEVF